MNRILEKLEGGDLRSIGRSDAIAHEVKTQRQFDELAEGLTHPDRLVVMRAADALEKITLEHPEFLSAHKRTVLLLLSRAEEKELKWHLGLLVPRLVLSKSELGKVWARLTRWALDMKESRIVRVNAIQGLFELSRKTPGLQGDYELTLTQIEREEIPSINARIRILRKRRDK